MSNGFVLRGWVWFGHTGVWVVGLGLPRLVGIMVVLCDSEASGVFAIKSCLYAVILGLGWYLAAVRSRVC